MPLFVACAVLKDRERRGLSHFSGGFGEGETPLPIPNRAVKPLSADGTWLARAWESRSPPVFAQKAGRRPSGLFRCKEAVFARGRPGAAADGGLGGRLLLAFPVVELGPRTAEHDPFTRHAACTDLARIEVLDDLRRDFCGEHEHTNR